MQRSSTLLLALVMLSASAATSLAQNTGTADPDSATAPAPPPTNYMQDQAAPIQRSGSNEMGPNNMDPNGQGPNGMGSNGMGPNRMGPNNFHPQSLANGQAVETHNRMVTAKVMPGVLVRVAPHSSIRAVSADAGGTELRLEHGLANINVYHPEEHSQILVSLPGGQTALVKDGIYTFNADTNTVRVFKGEARAYSKGANATDKGTKIKENHEVSFNALPLHSIENDPNQARADLIPVPNYARYRSDDDGGGYYGYPGYPYDGYGFGWGPYDYWGWGYPFGFGFYGGYGFRGGYGYRGGYGGGFRGGYGGGGGFHGGGGGGGHR